MGSRAHIIPDIDVFFYSPDKELLNTCIAHAQKDSNMKMAGAVQRNQVTNTMRKTDCDCGRHSKIMINSSTWRVNCMAETISGGWTS